MGGASVKTASLSVAGSSMKLNIHNIEEEPKRLQFEEPMAHLTADLTHGAVCDFDFPGTAHVQLDYYRAGAELFLQGHVTGQVVGHCARCLEDYNFPLATDFSTVLVPAAWKPSNPEEGESIDLDYYAADEIDLTPIVCERIVLALPTRPLCNEACKGLCAHCGANLNNAPCACPAANPALRLAPVRAGKAAH